MSFRANRGLSDDLCWPPCTDGETEAKRQEGTCSKPYNGCSSTPGPYSILFPVIPHCVLDWNGLGDVGYSKQQHLEEEKAQLSHLKVISLPKATN